MKQGKGKVPNFPNELKKLKPEDKAVWVGTGKKVYLTFDTGGELGDVDKMLKTLKDNDVKANYFIAGYNMKAHPDFLKRLVEDGHLVANHTMTHTDMTTQTDEQVKKEIDDFAAMYKSITGQEVPKIFRFPYGTFSYHLMDYISDMGYTSVFWSTAMRDWEPRENPDDPYNDIMNNLHDGNIILMHEGSKENIDALDKIIKGIKEKGYEFGLVSELIK
jgi:peptidoglycan-N-acetylmuramic acid deacetylase